MKQKTRSKARLLLAFMMLAVILITASTVAFAQSSADSAAPETLLTATADSGKFTLGEGEDAIKYDLSDTDSAHAYVDAYADNLDADPDFKTHIEAAIAKVRESIKSYATILSLLPPVIAIVLALITKEVYSSLIIGIVVGGVIYAGGNFEGVIKHVISDGFVNSLADSYNMGILIFLVLLGTLVSMMNKAGGSAAFGRWASKHIKSRIGAQLATMALGVLIFIDDYFNCLTVGSVMRPVTDRNNVSRAKLSYLIDATAAPICIIAPISSWAAAVAGFARGAGAENGISLFVSAIPFNFYALLTIVMMIFISVSKLDYGPMKLHEKNAVEKGDLFTCGNRIDDDKTEVNEKGRVCDLVIPVVILIICCVIGMIYSGGFFSGENFITAFSNSDASVGLAYGAGFAMIIIVIYFLIRRVISFKSIMESLPEGFKAMVPAILILTCAWTLKAMTDSLGAKIFISQLIQGTAGAFQSFLPAIIFLIAVGLSFATGTSWGTFGILIPIVLSVFSSGEPITIVAISACMAGAVCGDHCSPISDTTIMASAGAQCDHINHVSTQLPYALTVAGVSAVSYIIAGFVPNWLIVLPISIALMIGTLFVIKFVSAKKAK
ncbi:MAG: Na+/H+ antiporter NhaC family protein [Oscillospiraceae bacterium]|nr:Na+/H+ antiporter NhaC family protein [Oscillospiraceae bacterium]MDD7292783.1 Na+/H+ antiporter NhaC family protein [Clostridiaceae bacterium]MDY5991504.1 Na+/H+ antiporter NhaC family protein [Oscillospiraceae bacterium]